MSDTAVDVRDLALNLGGHPILDGVTFSIRPGERVGLIGPNGAGKTSLLKSLIRIHRSATGRITIDGRPLEETDQRALARAVAYVPQADGGATPFTVCEFVAMGRYPHLGPLTPPGEGDLRAVDAALDATETRALAHRDFDTLSGGEQQKVLLAAALAQETPILLLDEPTAHLDPPRQVEIHTLLKRIHAERNVTVLWITHDLNAALAHAERVLALRDGRLVFDGPAADIADVARLQSIFDHEFLVSPHPGGKRSAIYPE